MRAQVPSDSEFSSLLRQPGGIDLALVRAEARPGYEPAMARWLESAHPVSQQDRGAVDAASFRFIG